MSDTQFSQTKAGVIGFFTDSAPLVEAARKVREAKIRDFDCYTPFPVHGLDQAMGLKRSPLPYVTFLAGLTGLCLAFSFEYWTSAVDWPLIVGGKPMNSWPAFVPIMFELTVLLGGLSTVAALFLICGLPNVTRRAFDPSITRDRFALVIEAPKDPDDEEEAEKLAKGGYRKFSESEATALLKQLGASDVRTVYNEGWF